jgi:UV DNA damage endonuclease
MYSDPFILLNAPDEGVLRYGITGLVYQVQVLDLIGLDNSAKVQIPGGGISCEPRF